MEQTLSHWGDILVVTLYFAAILSIGLWSLCRPNRAGVKGYFLAGRDMVWWPVGASLFASNIGSEHFIGLAGTGAASGIAIVLYEWSSAPLVMLLAWFFLPVYLSAGVYTLPEYLQKRFGGRRLRTYTSCLALIVYIVTKIAVSIFAGALFIQLSLGWNMYLAIIVLLTITALYTVLGGLAAVIYTDTAQTIIMTIGAVVLSIIGFVKVGGYNNLERLYMTSFPSVRDTNSSCGLPRSDSFHIFRHPGDSDNPWPGLLLQSSVGCLWYWCNDQVIVQRTLAARNLTHAKGGAILAGYLKLLPLFLMIFPGMISRALYPDEVGCVDPDECRRICDNPVGCSNIAYPKLVITLLPVGLRGLLLAVMMSAIMSSLTSIFNSASTIFTMDLWRPLRPRASQRELVLVGRLCILGLCVVSVLWVPLVQSSAGGQLFVYIQAVQGYLGTPLGALFILAVFWRRMNEQGAFWGILTGHACGLTRLVLDLVYPAPSCGHEDTRPSVVADVHYTYFGQLNFLITALVGIAVSLLTAPPSGQQLTNVTWWTRKRGSTKLELADEVELPEQIDSLVKNEGEQSETQPDARVPKEPYLKRWFHFVCGIPDANTEVDTADIDVIKVLTEKPKWRRLVNINAAVALMVTAFLVGFYH